MKLNSCLVVAIGLFACAAAQEKPNILLILADDLGFSDVGCYGGEIETPHIDRLAAGGIRFTQFFNSGKCEPTRASLMSGQYWQDCGLGIKRGITIGQAMRDAGYATFALGKWHLDGNPVDRGFDHYFGHLSGASDYFRGNATHRLDAEPFKPKDDSSFYTTDANADYAIRFLDESHRENPDKPFFMYLAFNAPHSPLQAWPEDIEKYRGKYRAGWDALREQRYRRQIELGILKPEWKLSPRPETIPAWDSLTSDEQDFEDARMAVFAAMVDRMDQAIGRVLAKVEAMGEAKNTVVLFLSDNGASPYDHGANRTAEMALEGKNNLNYGLGWANLGVTPFRHYKRNTYNGGSCTPLIVNWPEGIRQAGGLTDQPGHIIDLMATFVDLAGGKPDPALPGKSLAPVFAGKQRTPHDALYFHLFNHRAIIAGDYKLASDWDRPWELFNLAADRSELNDLSAVQPERAAELAGMWERWAAKSGAKDLFKGAGGEPVYRRLGDAHEKFIGGGPEKSKSRKSSAKKRVPGGIRARIGTELEIEGAELVLTCTGDDSGLAFDRLPDLESAKSSCLTFSLLSNASGSGELYYTIDSKTTLPNGVHRNFDVVHDGQWHAYSIALENEQPLFGLRFDPCAGPGQVRIKELTLKDAAGKVLCAWPDGK
jgi:arylsulfatase